MSSVLKTYINWSEYILQEFETPYLNDFKKAKKENTYSFKNKDVCLLEVIDEKLFQNQDNIIYKVYFIEEKLNEKKQSINAFIKIDEDKYISLEYRFENDEYTLIGPNGDYIYGHEKPDGRIFFNNKYKIQLRKIIKRSYEHIEFKLKKKILRLLDKGSIDKAIYDIKAFI